MITSELPEHAPLIDELLDQEFGRERFKRPSYMLREGLPPDPELCLVKLSEDGALIGTLRFWRILIGDHNDEALLLGPVAVTQSAHNRGIGAELMRYGLERARNLGHDIVLLVGDLPYFKQFGFTREAVKNIEFPTWVDPHRFLGMELVPGALNEAHGMIHRDYKLLKEIPHTQEIDADV